MTKLDIKLLEIVLKGLNNINADDVYCKVSDTLLEFNKEDKVRDEVLKTLNLSNRAAIQNPLQEVKELLSAMIGQAKAEHSQSIR